MSLYNSVQFQVDNPLDTVFPHSRLSSPPPRQRQPAYMSGRFRPSRWLSDDPVLRRLDVMVLLLLLLLALEFTRG